MQNTYAFILSFLAALSTLIGYLLIYIKYNKEKIIKYSLSFAAGVMISVSVIDLIPESITLINKTITKEKTYIYLLSSIIIGTIIPIITNKIIKNKENNLYRVGILSMITIMMHNIPEGIITYLTARNNINLGISLTIAIALHNIPEGISIAIPIYHSTKNKKKAFTMTLISALSEPFGALIALLILRHHINDKIMGIILGLTVGVMINVAITELLPESFKYNEKRKTIFSFVLGIAFMVISIKIIK